MKCNYYTFILFLIAIIGNKTNAQTYGVMEFGTQTIEFTQIQNPFVSATENTLLNNFDVSGVSSGPIYSAIAIYNNGAGTNAIGSANDAVLGWFGNGNFSVTSGTIKNSNEVNFKINNMQFAYERAVGSETLNFVILGKKNNVEVGTLTLTAPSHNTEIILDFSTPSSGSFLNVDEITIIPSEPIFGGFSIDAIDIEDNATLSYSDVINSTNELYISTIVTDIFKIHGGTSDILNIKIYNLTGKKVIDVKNTNTVSVEHLKNGIYISEVTLKNGSIKRKKIIKE